MKKKYSLNKSTISFGGGQERNNEISYGSRRYFEGYSLYSQKFIKFFSLYFSKRRKKFKREDHLKVRKKN